MRQTIGTTTMFKAVLIFTLIFAAFISLAIIYNKTYKMKNEALNIIHKYEGVNINSLTIINKYLKNNGYSHTGKCDSDEYGMESLESAILTRSQSGKRYYYCLKNHCKGKSTICSSSSQQIFYNIKFFFNFSLPLFGDIGFYKITGETKGIRVDVGSRILN